MNRWLVFSIVGALLVGGSPLPAAESPAEEKQEHQANLDDSSDPSNTPLPPGIEKRGKLSSGLEKNNKTPHGWSQGKAWWKHPGQAHPGSHSTGNGGAASEHAGHAHHGHGHQ